jgi:hypothetical protein
MVIHLKKRGQVTIFILLAIILVVIALAIFFFIPKINSSTNFNTENPNAFIQSCLETPLSEVAQVISNQGGSYDPKFFYSYQDERLEYLCYQSEIYKATCTVQQPLLRNHVEMEIKNQIQDDVRNCFNELKSKYEAQGYSVQLNQGEFNVTLLPEKIKVLSDSELTLTKKDTNKFNSFSILVDNNLYEAVNIANEIVLWETALGEADQMYLMYKHQAFNIEKHEDSEDVKVYIIEELETGNIFKFASRSLIFPAGMI